MNDWTRYKRFLHVALLDRLRIVENGYLFHYDNSSVFLLRRSIAKILRNELYK